MVKDTHDGVYIDLITIDVRLSKMEVYLITYGTLTRHWGFSWFPEGNLERIEGMPCYGR